MEKPIIEVKNIGKKYNIIHQRGGYVALRDVLANTLKSPFSFLKNKAKQIAGLETKEDFWALKDINFTVNKGEIIGIIGKNGAGKSTLLKILSQITPPTTGEIKMHGKVGSLLEVGTGFHPELSGRENIFLNGAILGMTKKEISEKFDKIVEFAEIEKFLDTPVKHYSSGMYVRLAFSVAAHMEPDILIIDEVLAVGDAEFQKKCLGKMDEITKKDRRTILFVSHNMAAIKQLCEKTILLSCGKMIMMDKTDKVIDKYMSSKKTEEVRVKNNILGILSVALRDKENNLAESFNLFDEVIIQCLYKSDKDYSNINLGIYFKNLSDNILATTLLTSFVQKSIKVPGGDFMVIFTIPSIKLMPGEYEITSLIEENGIEKQKVNDVGRIIICYKNSHSLSRPGWGQGKYIENYKFEIKKILSKV